MSIRVIDVEVVRLGGLARYLLSDGRLVDVEERSGPGYWYRSMRKLSEVLGSDLHPRDYDEATIRHCIEESMFLCSSCHEASRALSPRGPHKTCEACVQSCSCYSCEQFGDRSIYVPET